MKSLAEHLGVIDAKHPEQPAEPFDPDMSDQDFCRGILCSPEYRASLRRRIDIDDLQPAVEAMLWNRAYGPVKEKIEFEDKTPRLQDVAFDELEHRLLRLLQHTRQLRTNEADASDEDADLPRVH